MRMRKLKCEAGDKKLLASLKKVTQKYAYDTTQRKDSEICLYKSP
jgi:hypothetical protein